MSKKFGVDIKWLTVSSFEMRFGDTTVLTDPCITECKPVDLDYNAVEKCDIICVSHAHWDHITDIPRLMQKFEPNVLCGELTALPLAKWLNCPASKIYPVCPNLELDFNDVKIKALFGRHKCQTMGYIDKTNQVIQNEYCKANAGLAELQGVGSLEYRNYLFTTPNGTKILIWGNDVTVEQINMCKALQPDIAILQRSKTEKQHKEMARFVKEIGCKIVIPHHHDFKKFDGNDILIPFKQEIEKIAPEVQFIFPEHGKWIIL